METNLNKIKAREIMPGCHGKVIHGEKMTWVFWDIEQNAIIPEHNHPHEQIMHVIEGKFEFTYDGIKKDYGPGSIVHIASNIYHIEATF